MKFVLSLILLSLLFVSNGNASPLRATSEDNHENRATGAVKFFLYTQANPTAPQELFLNNPDSIRKSNFDSKRQTKVIIHGWGGSYLGTPNRPLREAYLQNANYNIITIDWNEYSKLNYISARAKVPVVGEDVAEFIDYLNQEFGLRFDMLVVIGHSLGAHVAGFTGKNVKNGRLPAIVGLDPAFPLYSFENPETRLADTDADYVQSIQTNGNVKGFFRPIGSATFYPNWGRNQPGCGLDLDGTCSHARSVSYYAEAVRGYSFAPIRKCSSFEEIVIQSGCPEVDYRAAIGDPFHIERVNGLFYFATNSEPPFGQSTEKQFL